jgi:vancomycin resistance protein VanJ
MQRTETTPVVTTATQMASGRRKHRLLPISTIYNVAFLLALWVVETYMAERHRSTTFLTYMPQHMFGIFTVLLILWATFRREWKVLAGNAVVFILFSFYFLGLNVPLPSTSDAVGTPLRVMTYNILYGSDGAQQVAKLVERQQPDVFCLQEASDPAASDAGEKKGPVPELRRLLPGWHLARSGEFATFSRYPIVSKRVHRASSDDGRGILETAIMVEGQRLTVFNVHFSNSLDSNSSSSRNPISRDAMDVRTEQLADLLRATRTATTPFIIMGDFNTPPRGRIYRRLDSHFQDAFRAAGWGLGYTYRSNLPLIRIDYVFASPEIHVRQCFVCRARASDHNPVVAQLVLPR